MTVYWGVAAATDRKNIDDAYQKMVQSPYLDWLREYDAGGQKSRRGVGVFTSRRIRSRSALE